MKFKKRLLAEKLKGLTEHFSVVVLSGGRQVGKSTLIGEIFPDWDNVVFDPVIDVGNANEDPELFLNNHPVPLVLDEIQYSPKLVPVIKRRIDEHKKPGMYILTGSQQWSVMKSISESLAGRAVFLDLDGFSLSEICEDLPKHNWVQRYLESPFSFVQSSCERLNLHRSIYEILWRGGLPEADTLPLNYISDYFTGYIRTYIERDVRLMLDVGDWQQFSRFIQLISALTAQEVNYSILGREISVTPQTARRWLSVLSGTFQRFELPAYHGNLIKRISSKPKGYWSDTGVASYLCRISSPNALEGHPGKGALFETFIIGEIRKLLGSLGQKPQLYHWRLHSGSEVDLIMEFDGMFFPVEIKFNSRPKPKDARGLRAFREKYPHLKIAPGIIIAPCGQIERLTENEYCIPWDSK